MLLYCSCVSRRVILISFFCFIVSSFYRVRGSAPQNFRRPSDFVGRTLCLPSSERTTNPSSRRRRQGSLSVARPLPTETASLGFGGSPVGGGDKSSRFAFFRHFYVRGVVSLPSACASCRRNAGRPRVTAAYLPFLCRTGARPVRAEDLLVGYTRHPVSKPRTQRLTRRNTGHFHCLRHRQGR